MPIIPSDVRIKNSRLLLWRTNTHERPVAPEDHVALDLSPSGEPIISEDGRPYRQITPTDRTAPGRRLMSAESPKIVNLVACEDDEVWSSVTAGCTVSVDDTNFKLRQGTKFTFNAGAGFTAWLDPPGSDDPITLYQGAEAIGMWIYIPDITKVTNITLHLYSNSGLSVSWSRSLSNGFTPTANGWQLLRFAASDGNLTGWGTIYAIRLIFTTSAATEVTLGQVWAEIGTKAKLLFIADGPYKNFLTIGYPDLKRRGIPVTWSTDPAILGTGSGTTLRMTEAELLAVADENDNQMNYHGWDGTATSGMTASELQQDTIKAIKWLNRRGYFPKWRSSFVQGLATEHAAIESLVLANATWQNNAGLTCWPPPFRHNILRNALHTQTTATLDTFFTNLETTRQLMLLFTHGVDDGNPLQDTTHTLWDYFLAKVDNGLSEGWLEGVTFEQLAARSGLIYRQTFGDWLSIYVSKDGVSTGTRLP